MTRYQPTTFSERPLLLERFYAKWEFAVRCNMSASDPAPVSMKELLAMADDEARNLWDSLTLGYPQPDGHDLVRAEIAGQYHRIAATDVTLTTGAQEALFLLSQTLVGPGDHAVVVTPAYQLLHEGVRRTGASVTRVPLRSESSWRLEPDPVTEAFRPETRLLVLNFPHNPTGSLPDKDTFTRLIELCHSRGIRVLSDEVFRGTEHNLSDQLPAAADVAPSAVSVGDLSKSYGLAGLRVGWVASRDPAVMAQIATGRDYTTICGSGPSQALALIALRARTTLQARARRIVQANLALVDEYCRNRNGVLEWVPPVAGTTAFPRFLAVDVEAFCERLAEAEGVLLAPGSVFETGGGHFRLGLGQHGLEEGLAAVDRVLTKTP